MYSAKLWAKIRLEYESGKFSSFDDLHKKLSQNYEKFPSEVAITQRSLKEGWKKAILAPVIEKSIRDKMIEYAAQKGFEPQKAVVDTLSEALSATKPCIIPSMQKDDEGNKEPGMAMEIEDWQARLKAVEHLAKLFDLNASEKKELLHSGLPLPPTEITYRVIEPDSK